LFRVNFVIINFEIIDFVTEPNDASQVPNSDIYVNNDQKENLQKNLNFTTPGKKGGGIADGSS
jgi:hypothetical protein